MDYLLSRMWKPNWLTQISRSQLSPSDSHENVSLQRSLFTFSKTISTKDCSYHTSTALWDEQEVDLPILDL